MSNMIFKVIDLWVIANLMKKDKVKYVEISFDDKLGEISFAGKSTDWGLDWDVDYESIQALDYQDPDEQ